MISRHRSFSYFGLTKRYLFSGKRPAVPSLPMIPKFKCLRLQSNPIVFCPPYSNQLLPTIWWFKMQIASFYRFLLFSASKTSFQIHLSSQHTLFLYSQVTLTSSSLFPTNNLFWKANSQIIQFLLVFLQAVSDHFSDVQFH